MRPPATGDGDSLPRGRGYAAPDDCLPAVVRRIAAGFPGSLISILIYGFALLQAWRMTASREVVISGPFKVGTAGAT